MDAILPLKVSGDYQQHDLERAKILVCSLELSWSSKDELDLFVICPENEISLIKEGLSFSNLKISFISQEDLLCKNKYLKDCKGWYKQQVIKLAAHRILSSKFYLTLDADLICAKSVSEDSFIINDKAIVDWESKKLHVDWWNNSGKILDQTVDLETFGMSVTPEILCKEVCENLEYYLRDMYNTNAWDVLLSKEGWTEYTIYTLFCEKFNLLNLHYHPPSKIDVNNSSLRTGGNTCFWNLNQYLKWDPSVENIELNSGYFMICQSSSHIPPGYILDKISTQKSEPIFRRANISKPKHVNQLDFLCALYRGILGRNPDATGLTHYLRQFEKNVDLSDIVRQISSSEEARKKMQQ